MSPNKASSQRSSFPTSDTFAPSSSHQMCPTTVDIAVSSDCSTQERKISETHEFDTGPQYGGEKDDHEKGANLTRVCLKECLLLETHGRAAGQDQGKKRSHNGRPYDKDMAQF